MWLKKYAKLNALVAARAAAQEKMQEWQQAEFRSRQSIADMLQLG